MDMAAKSRSLPQSKILDLIDQDFYIHFSSLEPFEKAPTDVLVQSNASGLFITRDGGSFASVSMTLAMFDVKTASVG